MNDKKDDIELRSEDFQEILGDIPSWIQRRGITAIAILILILLLGSAFFRYPDIILTKMTLTGSSPAVAITAKATGRLKELAVSEIDTVSIGQYLAVIENSAVTKDIVFLKEYLLAFDIEKDTIYPMPPKNLQVGNIQSLYSLFYITLFDFQQFNSFGYYPKKIDYMSQYLKQHILYHKTLTKQHNITLTKATLAKNQFSRDSSLNVHGVISNEEFETAKNQYLQHILTVEAANSTIQNAEMQMTQLQENLLDINLKYIEEENKLKTQLRTYITQLYVEI